MTRRTIIILVLSIFLISSLYKFTMIRCLKNKYSTDNEGLSFVDFGIAKVDFTPFVIFKLLHLQRLLEFKYSYKIMRLIYLFQVFFIVLLFILLFIIDYYDTVGYLDINLKEIL